MRMTCDLPDDAECCEVVLDALVEVARKIIRELDLAPFPQEVNGVWYKLEPEGEEDWKLPHNVIRDGWGDCEDMCIYHCAGLRETGEDPGAMCRIVRTARNKLHCVVQRSDGTFDDPSIDMMKPEDLRRFTDAR